MIEFSFLLPTRGRPQLVERFLQSVVDTTAALDSLEIVLCVDDNDPASQAIEHSSLRLKKVVVPCGSTMGELNRAAFAASSGRYVMLMNDDVILRTRGWDRELAAAFRQFDDDVALIHVNDLLFREKLCTFPCLSRRTCLEIGVCPAGYRRYRLDDHIYDTYCLLAHLGQRRIVYLPEVVFEHENHSSRPAAGSAEVFQSTDRKIYVPDQEILQADAALFDRKLDDRKGDALRLAGLIDQSVCDAARRRQAAQLRSVDDSRTCRKPEYIRTRPAGAASRPSESTRVTVAVVTGDLRQPHAARCVSLLKQQTANFDLWILDNNGSSDFNHPREMNKVLRTATSEFVVLLDDDVYVEPGWLDGLLRAIDDRTGVVAPLHKDAKGNISFSGVYLMGDDLGTHAHHVDVPAAPRAVQCLCSAALLIDRRKCGEIRFSEEYNKYFLDIDHSLRVWEAGYRVVCTPEAIVTHLAGATLPHGSERSRRHWNQDLKTFRRTWIESGRLGHIEQEAWVDDALLGALTGTPRKILALLDDDLRSASSRFACEVENLLIATRPYPLFRSLLVTTLRKLLRRCHAIDDRRTAWLCEQALDRLAGTSLFFGGPVPLLLEEYRGVNLVAYDDEVYALRQSLGVINLQDEEDRARFGVLVAPDLGAAKELVDEATLERDAISQADGSCPASKEPVLVEEGYKGFNVILCGPEYFAIRQSDGAFELQRVVAGRYRPCFRGPTPVEVKALVKQFVDHPLRFRAKALARSAKRRVRARLARSTKFRQEITPVRSPEMANSGPVVPQLIAEGYRGFNVIAYGGKFYGIRQADGAFHAEGLAARRYRPCLQAATPDKVKSLIDRSAGRPFSTFVVLARTTRRAARATARLAAGRSPGTALPKRFAPDKALSPLRRYRKITLADNCNITNSQYEMARRIAADLNEVLRATNSGLAEELRNDIGKAVDGAAVHGTLQRSECILNPGYDFVNRLRLECFHFTGYQLSDVVTGAQTPSWTDRIAGSISAPLLEAAPDWSVAAFCSEAHAIPDDLICRPPVMLGEVGWQVDGGVVNRDVLAHQERIALLHRAGVIEALRSRKAPRIVEIGAGYGGLAYFLKQFIPEATCYLCDLPCSLFFSASYLSLTRNDLAHEVYNRSRRQRPDDAQGGYVYIPHAFFEDFADLHVDLAINTLSFAEMDVTTLERYATQLSRMLGAGGMLFEQNFDNSHDQKPTFCNPVDVLQRHFADVQELHPVGRWGPARVWSNFANASANGELLAGSVPCRPAVHSRAPSQSWQAALDVSAPAAVEGRLVEQGHKGFDIFYFDTKYFAVQTGQAAFDFLQVTAGRRGLYHVGNTLPEVKREIELAQRQAQGGRPKALVLGGVDRDDFRRFLPQLEAYDFQLLVPANQQESLRGFSVIAYLNQAGDSRAPMDLGALSQALLSDLKAQGFELLVAPMTVGSGWRTSGAERLAIELGARLMFLYPDGRQQLYKGEDLHRIRYNASYLNSMFRFVPDLAGRRLLDVGCSDGLVCHLLLNENPADVVGIDVLETVGCRYPHPRIAYHRMDATRLQFADASFDVCVSIATFEHVPDPPRALAEIRRVLRPGGYAYLQAGPLYYSPFGHHMFGYFDDYPWIHLRLSPDEIVERVRRLGIDRGIEAALGNDSQHYVESMLSHSHINHKRLAEYGLDEFQRRTDVEIVYFQRSYEGGPLLTEAIRQELSLFDADDLTAHGYELLFRRR